MKTNTLYTEVDHPEWMNTKRFDGLQSGNMVTFLNGVQSYVVKSDVYMPGVGVPVEVTIGHMTGNITITKKPPVFMGDL